MDKLVRSPQQMGQVLCYFRRSKGITQVQLAEESMIRQATISQIESGKGGIQFATICRILAKLDLEIIVRPRSKAKDDWLEEMFL